MRLSQNFTRTLKEAPADEVSRNAQLLIRAGFVYKVMAGVYAYTPLGLRVLENIKQVVREEMNAVNGQELIMSSLQRKETWEGTGRWDDEVVDVWFKSKLKDGTEVGFGWSHEEAIMEMMQQYVKSYKDLPASVYQFQTKLRNELRAKSGIMRGREFVMKDMYSLHSSQEDLDAYYAEVMEAYKKVYNRMGIGDDTYITFASGGAFTEFSHEFQTVCDAGEDIIYRVPSTKESYNEEIAPTMAPSFDNSDESDLPLEEVEGVDLIGVEPLAQFLGIPVEKTTKTMLYQTDTGEVVAAAVRGGYKVNEDKLRSVLSAQSIKLADEETVRRITGAEVGYAGILNLPDEVRVVVDESCAGRKNFEMGANRTHYHSINVNWGRDLPLPDKFYDIKTAKKGDLHPDTGEEYEVLKTAETGNIFNFGTDKAEQMGILFTDATGKQQPVHLASYGIGITRVMGVIVEKFADAKGMVWPEAVAPARVYLVQIGKESVAQADGLYDSLQASSVEVIYDDRDERPGTKFADAELIGIPYRVTVSDRLLESGKFEFTSRATGETELLTRDDILDRLN
ncbi:MAG: proline--tRNA ligase [Candidatus Saccharimonas sp.]